MKKLRGKDALLSAASYFVPALGLLFALLLFFYSINRTYYVGMDPYLGEFTEQQLDNPYLNILFIAFATCVFFLFWKFSDEISMRVIYSVMLVLVFALGFGFVYSASRIPAGDAEIVANAAYMMAKGGGADMESYFAEYPFRLGLAFFEEILFRLLMVFYPKISKGYCFMALQVFNVLCLMLGSLALVKISGALTGSARCAKLTAVLICFSTPAMLSCSSLSGRMPAMCFSFAAFWAYLEYRRGKRFLHAFLCVALLALAQSIKLDSCIAFIALSISMLVSALEEKRGELMKLFLVLLAVVSLAALLPVALFAWRFESEKFSDRQTLYSAMGFGEEEDAYLHYDGLYSVMTHSGNETRHESEAGETGFVWDAFQAQWNEPSFRTLHNNRDSLHYRETGHLYRLFCYDMEKPVLSHMNMHHSFVLFGLLMAFVIIIVRRDGAMLLPALFVLGGLLFHLLFQAKSQHGLKYFMMMLPLAAYGFDRMFVYKSNKSISEEKSK